jgi:hypothetical protein
MNVNKKIAQQAADAIAGAFAWDDSPEGYEYWADIHAILLMYSIGAQSNVQIAPDVNAINSKASLKKISLVHIFHLGQTLCGLKLQDMPAGAAQMVNITNKDKGTCLLCKSKAPL